MALAQHPQTLPFLKPGVITSCSTVLLKCLWRLQRDALVCPCQPACPCLSAPSQGKLLPCLQPELLLFQPERITPCPITDAVPAGTQVSPSAPELPPALPLLRFKLFRSDLCPPDALPPGAGAFLMQSSRNSPGDSAGMRSILSPYQLFL